MSSNASPSIHGYTCRYLSPLGEMLMASDGEALTGLWFVGQRYEPVPLSLPLCEASEMPIFEQTSRWLRTYFEGADPGATPPVRLEGTPFRIAVWKILQDIPYGTCVTYGDIARRLVLGDRCTTRISAQAVGGAVGHNPVSIIIPCHRVIGADGRLTGYAGGINRKMKLLEMENCTTKVHF